MKHSQESIVQGFDERTQCHEKDAETKPMNPSNKLLKFLGIEENLEVSTILIHPLGEENVAAKGVLQEKSKGQCRL